MMICQPGPSTLRAFSSRTLPRVFNLILAIGALLTAASTAAGATVFIDYTGVADSWVVPVGVTSIDIQLWGAGGGSIGGSGAYVAGTLLVTPGELLNLIVGGGGGSTVAGPVLGGFGGGGSGFSNGAGAAGGGGGRTSIARGSTLLALAGAGAGGNGTTTGGGGGNFVIAFAGSGFGGGPGSAASGGTANPGAAAGSSLQGGNGATAHGGGGGAGFFGGGGGGSNQSAISFGGGGGGSSYASFALSSVAVSLGASGAVAGVLPGNAADANYLAGIGVGGAYSAAGGNGRIVISYADPVPEPTSLSMFGLGAVLLAWARRLHRNGH